jgi:hypothetical protein
MPKKPNSSPSKPAPVAPPAAVTPPPAAKRSVTLKAAKPAPKFTKTPPPAAKPLGSNGSTPVALKPLAPKPAPRTAAKKAVPAAFPAAPVASTRVAPASKKTASRKKATAQLPPPTVEEISLRAYFIAEKRRAEGRHADPSEDWVEAERQILAERA